MRRGRTLLVLLTIFLLSFSTACKKTTTAKKPSKKGGVFAYSLREPLSIDPVNVQTTAGFEVARELFDGLVDYDPVTQALVPAVAKSWESNREADVFTFHLRRGTKFHNNREVTAADFKYAWERVAAKESGSDVAYHLAPIKGFAAMQTGKAKHLDGVKVKDKYTLIVSLNYPFADFPYLLGQPVFSPVPREEVEKNPKAFAQSPVGNGPFMMREPWKHRRSIKVKRFKDYYGRPAYLDKVNFKIFSDINTNFLEFKSGNLNYAPIPPGQAKATKEEFGKNAIMGKPLLSLSFLGYNLHSAPLDNKLLRRAISKAIDRQGIAEAIYEDVQIPAYGLVPPLISGARPPQADFQKETAEAKKLLKEAGYPEGKGLKKLKLYFIAGGNNTQLAQAIQGSLAKVGINVEVKGVEPGAFFAALRRGKMNIFIAEWIADYPISDSFLYSLFDSQSGDNMVGYQNKKVDKLLLKARRTLDVTERRRRYRQAERVILADMPVAPLFYSGISVLRSRNVRGFVRTAQDYTPLENVWLKKAD